MIDSTTVKVHQTAASMSVDEEEREIGRSAGGLTTKIHQNPFIGKYRKNPLDFSLTAGQIHDSLEGEALIERNLFRFRTLLAGKGYDVDRLRERLKTHGKIVCIPLKSNRKNLNPMTGDFIRNDQSSKICPVS